MMFLRCGSVRKIDLPGLIRVMKELAPGFPIQEDDYSIFIKELYKRWDEKKANV
jgi:hypothetical protein